MTPEPTPVPSEDAAAWRGRLAAEVLRVHLRDVLLVGATCGILLGRAVP